ncbi:hypothetical protein BO94DRAFT_6958 [Aspergillus sclerotioniger CBS 115572]|uniref:Uncharacterized protein n=1 Tax=Aspergillus sclerotioniger CBS 115572 TaxID=1450535 RepID=A0A317XH16_9EURO|nr:hypothetical protein BO94DRAFT_6958 [Aspergillus sclerotioniger CBS 115572]PWY96350.1 hypothetical protein BO94DRAFT_6958 [Aspergillus sclerotioniger CBS 115572]
MFPCDHLHSHIHTHALKLCRRHPLFLLSLCLSYLSVCLFIRYMRLSLGHFSSGIRIKKRYIVLAWHFIA